MDLMTLIIYFRFGLERDDVTEMFPAPTSSSFLQHKDSHNRAHSTESSVKRTWHNQRVRGWPSRYLTITTALHALLTAVFLQIMTTARQAVPRFGWSPAAKGDGSRSILEVQVSNNTETWDTTRVRVDLEPKKYQESQSTKDLLLRPFFL